MVTKNKIKKILICLFCYRFRFDKDPHRNIMKKLNGVNTVNGVFTGEFQLSYLPKLGEWKITATVGEQVSMLDQGHKFTSHLFLFCMIFHAIFNLNYTLERCLKMNAT